MIKRLAIVFVLFLFAAVGAAYWLYDYYTGLLEPLDPHADHFRVVEIPSGSGAEAIAEILHEENIIQDALAFRFFVRLLNSGHTFIAGSYRLSPAMSLEEIVGILQAGEVYTETVWFTIPEGLTVEEIAERLEREGLPGGESFLSLARDPFSTLGDSYPQIMEANQPDIIYPLEGYLFPDTYEVPANASAEKVAAIMVKRLLEIVDAAGGLHKLETGYTLHEVLTVASLVEREGRVDHERPLIAGVFYNRLRDGWLLESCATIQYLLEEVKDELTYQDLEIESPYNTYRNPGLPPGPIASPGRASIEAALNPDQTDYYYFVYKRDGSGEHYFSRTYDEHIANRDRAESGR